MADIEIKYYDKNGNRVDVRHYSDIENAFLDMVDSGKQALAYSVGTTSGAYSYEPTQQGHTLELFKAKLACCCNDAREYSNRIAKLNSRW